MRKYLLLIAAIFSLISCTDKEEIGLQFHHEIPIEVNPLSLYENSGIDVVKFQSLIGTDVYQSCVTVLIYNPDGSLNQKNELLFDELRPVSYIAHDLDEKDYTIISIQHFVIVANGKTSSSWKLEEEDNIKTVHISVSSLDGEISWFNCLGIDVQNVSIKRNTKLNIATQLAGSFVDFQYENFDKSNYIGASLYFKDKANGIYLNPEYTGNDRYYYKNGFNAPNVWSNVAGFSSDDGLKNTQSETKFIFETGKINYCFGLMKSDDITEDGTKHFTAFPSTNSYFEFEKGKIYKAYCYYNGSDDVIATYLDLSSGFTEWYDSFDKWIAPIFEEPYTKWGCSVEDVKSFMDKKNYTLWYDIIENQQNGSFSLGYIGKYSENNIQYVFSSRANDLFLVLIAIEHAKANPTEVINSFIENELYSKVDKYDEYYAEYGCYIFVNDKSQVEIYPDMAFSDGTPITQIVYAERTYPEESSSLKSCKLKSTNKCYAY